MSLPESTTSPEALEFIGLTSEAAVSIINSWQTFSGDPDWLIDFIQGHVSRLNPRDSQFSHLDDDEAMRLVGISQNTRSAILDPSFEAIYATETLHFWVKDTLRINLSTLQILQDRMRDTAISLDVAAEAQKPSLPEAYTLYGEPQTVLPNHLVLYKALAVEEFLGHDFIEEDGSINLAPLDTYHTGDFNPRNAACYFTQERQTAEAYRGYAERRCPWSDTWMIRIQVPMDFLQTLRKEELWFSDDFKEYVWNCRTASRMPSKFDYLWEEGRADVIQGHVCGTNSTQLHKIKKDEVQAKFDDSKILRINGRPATQYVFMQNASTRQLCREIRGKVNVEIFASKKAKNVGGWWAEPA